MATKSQSKPSNRRDDAENHQQGRLAAALTNFNLLPDDGRVRTSTAAALFGISLPTLWRRVKAKQLPQPRRDGGLSTFRAGDIRAALNDGPTSLGLQTERMTALGSASAAKRRAKTTRGANAGR
jgi:predicted DNA-binding transcriptional regulator AlpA